MMSKRLLLYFLSSSHPLSFFPPLSLSLIPPNYARISRLLLCSTLSNPFLLIIPVLGIVIPMASLLILKQSLGRRVVIVAHGMGSHVIGLNLASNDFSGSSVSVGFGRFSSLTHLNLSDSGFSGLISSEISHLSNLVSLDLSWNSDAEFAPHGFNSLVQNLTKLQKLHLRDLSSCGLHGRFPDHDIHFPKLEVLDLQGNNDLSGNFPRFRSIPASLENLTQITSLNLDENLFSGKIPNVFSNLRNLISLHLHGNNFSGQLPSSIGNLTNLQGLNLYDNQLEGVIPSFVNGFLSLSYVDLGYNLFNGIIPSWLYALPSLVVLYLDHNKLTGHIGEFQSDSLELICLKMNKLHGPIPSSIFKLVNLRYLHLSSNNLSGVLETSNFGKLRNLTSLDLSNNMLSSITSSNSNSILPSIQRLDFSNNNISGVWSWNMGKNTLQYLNLSYNSISGFEMLPWENLYTLDLHSNLLQGPLPTLPNSTFFFSVSHNKLSGEISSLICKASSMRIFDLSNNNLSGVLPHCLGNFSKDLFVLNLRRNQFHGIIPQTFLKGNAIRNLDFNDNQLEGPVPRSLIICRKLEVLDLGNNKINDTFPHWLGTLPELQVLVLRSNSFHGHIGRSKIKSPFMSLRIIDLAHNDFEGDLPEMYLRSLKAIMNIDEGNMTRKYMGEEYYQDSIVVTIKRTYPIIFGNLKLLESLDLSSNKLIGRIPQELTSLTFLEVLNLSQNHLTGFIPQGNQFDTFGNDSYNENSGLCGFPLSKKCIIDETPESSKETDAEFDGGFDWKITLMGYGCGLIIGLSLGCLIFLTGKPKWLTTMVEENIHKKITRSKKGTCRRGARRK
ncbi:Receptor-like protein 12 [Vitis vinifera]|uniref:Receptor-like protein 12 n=1 Tax=Vitis vinifera TaxID=29760 RepID=A0A438GRZ7_VITVI|nr:Receptor-like protein 12 [Vitis vinifera]